MLEIHGISKAYGTVRANEDVSLRLESAEIVGLLGENGAGKSTLLAIASGYLKPDAGHVTLDGQSLRFGSPRRAISLGIGLVHQHLSVIPAFTVREQLALAGYRGQTLPPLIASLDPDACIADLALGQRQRLEIARAMVSHPRVLMLDEPTSILTPNEVEELFGVLRELRDGGTTIVLVTHKLHEVLDIADRMVVMARGHLVDEVDRSSTGMWPEGTAARVLGSMFGEGASPAPEPASNFPVLSVPTGGKPLLQIVDVTINRHAGSSFISAEFMPGRLYTIAGIDGEGQRPLAMAAMGHETHTGRVLLDGEDISSCDPMARTRLGMALLTDDKRGEGAIPAFSLAENLFLSRARRRSLQRRGVVQWPAVNEAANRVINDWRVSPADPNARFGALSGGNMQRFLVGAELMAAPRVVMALNPVQGLDARTSAFLWQRFRDVCDGGGVVIAFLSDLDEAIQHGDCISVMRGGQLSPFEERPLADRSRLAGMMVNGW